MFRDDNIIFEKGFTLIEMVMTLVIISILSVTALPRFFSTLTFQKSVYSAEILNTLRYARKLAVASGSHIQVTLTPTSIILQRRIEGPNCTTGTGFFPISDPADRSGTYVKQAPGAVSLTFTGNWPLYFDALGQATQASNCTVINNATVSIVGGDTVTVIGVTGFVQ